MTEIIYDYSKLKGKIKEKYGSQTAFARNMHMDDSTLSKKLNNIVEFNQSEMNKTCILLNEPLSKVEEYFFTHKVQVIEQK